MRTVTATSYGYNTAGYLTSTTDAFNQVTQSTYDAVGNRTVVVDALGRTTTSAYDANNRLIQVTAPLTTTTRYEYDGNGIAPPPSMPSIIAPSTPTIRSIASPPQPMR